MKSLFDSGILTKDEFEQKSELLRNSLKQQAVISIPNPSSTSISDSEPEKVKTEKFYTYSTNWGELKIPYSENIIGQKAYLGNKTASDGIYKISFTHKIEVINGTIVSEDDSIFKYLLGIFILIILAFFILINI